MSISISSKNGNALKKAAAEQEKQQRENKKTAEIQKKLSDLTEQLNAVRAQRAAATKVDDGRVYGPKTDYSVVPKKFFSHPKLEYVYGEIMFSPYMNSPKDPYPASTYTMNETIKELKRRNISFHELPEEDKPYDENLIKRSFIKEVCNYNPKFNVPKLVRIS